MKIVNIILITLGSLMLIESLIASLFPSKLIKLMKKSKTKKKIKKAGKIELIVAIVILMIGILI